jgi:hypothetical protein
MAQRKYNNLRVMAASTKVLLNLNRYRKVSSKERKTRTPPKSARQNNAKARAGNNMDTKKRRRLDESPGLVQINSSSSDSESSPLSSTLHTARNKEGIVPRKAKRAKILSDDDSDR